MFWLHTSQETAQNRFFKDLFTRTINVIIFFVLLPPAYGVWWEGNVFSLSVHRGCGAPEINFKKKLNFFQTFFVSIFFWGGHIGRPWRWGARAICLLCHAGGLSCLKWVQFGPTVLFTLDIKKIKGTTHTNCDVDSKLDATYEFGYDEHLATMSNCCLRNENF